LPLELNSSFCDVRVELLHLGDPQACQKEQISIVSALSTALVGGLYIVLSFKT